MNILTKLKVAVLAMLFISLNARAELALEVYQAGPRSFHVSSTLLSGESEAMVVDAGFTRADALNIAANVLNSGKELKYIFVSQADPDYYFGASQLKALFPNAKVLATPAVAKKIAKTIEKKVAFWGPKMGENAPVNPIKPEVYSDASIKLDGVEIEIRGTSGLLAHRPYLWVPAQKLLLGNVGIFNGLHVWTADTQTPESIQAWLDQLDEMRALAPKQVIAGHMAQGAAQTVAAIDFTQTYLQRFVEAKKAAQSSAELIEKMNQYYPNAGLAIALDIGAKVHLKEMSW